MEILMPALSPTMEQGTLVKWLVGPGDAVSPGDILAEIETDKAAMEVEAAEGGVIAELLVAAGTEDVAVNTPIARLGGVGSAMDKPQGPSASAALVGGAEAAVPAVAVVPTAEAPVEPQGVVETGDATPARAEFAVAAPFVEEPRLVSPLARRIAAKRGIDLAAIEGTGPKGRIIRVDLEARATADAPAGGLGPLNGTATPTLAQMGILDGSYDLIPLDGMRRTVARRMTESFRDTPHFPLTLDLKIDALLETRARLNAGLAGDGVIKVSVNDMILCAAAIALRREPRANASWTPEGIAMHHHADIAMAVAVDGGLITPIIRGAEAKGLAAIAVEAKTLAERARKRDLRPDEYQGGTFSVSNLGMFGIRSFTSILNAPQGAILSVGVGEKRPVAHDGALTVATVMSVTLTCDHRVVDGAVGAAWLAVFRGLIEDPMTMLL